MNEALLHTNEQKEVSWFVCFFLFKIESTCREDAMKTVEMTINNLEYHINLVNKTTVGLEDCIAVIWNGTFDIHKLCTQILNYLKHFRSKKIKSHQEVISMWY